MWKMLQQKKPDDYVISTGKTYTIKDFVNRSAKKDKTQYKMDRGKASKKKQ